MRRAPLRPRDRPALERPSWGSVLAGYALVPAFLLSLWAISQPVTATVVLATALGVFLGGRRLRRLARCFRNCGGFSVVLGDRVRITFANPTVDDAT